MGALHRTNVPLCPSALPDLHFRTGRERVRNSGARDKHGASKEGSGRVSVSRATGLTYVYTLECNYNVGKHVNRLQPPHVPC